MAGIFGVLDLTGRTLVNEFLQGAASCLSHFSWYVSDQWIAPDVPLGLGRSGIGILNPETQPVISADRRYVLMMSGEFHHKDDLRKKLCDSGIVPNPDTMIDPELALSAYKAFGIDFAKVLEGAFIIAIYDSVEHRLIITNDRFGLYPTFYAYRSGQLAFAPEVKGVLCAPFVERELNPIAVSEFFCFQQVLGSKTFHQGISQFPYASVGEFDLSSGDWKLRHYWDWDEIPDRSEISLEDAVAETGRLLRQTLADMTRDSLRPGVFLSGGLDSRTIVGLMPHRAQPVITATFGVEGCRDQFYGEKIARAAGTRHQWFDLPDGKWVQENADLHMTLTEGFHAWMHMHSITMLPDLRKVMDYNLTGWAGEFPLGYPMIADSLLYEPVDRLALLQELFYRLNQTHSWPGLTEGESRLLYTPVFREKALGQAFDSMVEEFKPYERFRKNNQVDYFFLVNHCGRMTGNMIKIARSHMEVRFPYWDFRFIEFVYSLNPRFRMGRPRGRLYMNLITREIPNLVSIPYDKDEYLPTADERRRAMQAMSVRVRRRLGLFPKRATLYADYENYLRRDLRGWAEDILFDPRTKQREIMNMDFVRSLFNRHMNGREEWTIGKIAPLMTFELMMRQLFD